MAHHGGHGHMPGMGNHSVTNHTMMNHTMMNHTMMNHTMMGTDHTAAGGGHAGHGTGQLGHLTAFYFGHNLELLFDSWQITTPAGLVGAAFFVFFLAVVYEALKTLREYLLYAALRKRKQRNSKSQCPCNGGEMAKIDKAGTCELGMCETPCECPEKKTPEPVVGFARLSTSKCKRIASLQYYSVDIGMHILQSILHVIQIGTGYILMLVAMTFNVWLFLTVIFGFGAGYFFFGRMRYFFSGNFRESNECCS